MARQETVKLVTGFIAEICEIDEKTILANGKLVGYGLDSVRVLDLIMAVEDALDVEISENDPKLASVQTVEDLASLIDERRGE